MESTLEGGRRERTVGTRAGGPRRDDDAARAAPLTGGDTYTNAREEPPASLTDHVIGHVDLDLSLRLEGHLTFDALVGFLLRDQRQQQQL